MSKNPLSVLIKNRRKEIKLTQQDFANKVGVSLMTVVRWEKGIRTPNIDLLPNIAEALNTSEAYLMGMSTEKTNASVYSGVNISQLNTTDTARDLPSMSYWGGVADNAQKVAKYGNETDKADVLQMLKRAFAAFSTATEQLASVNIHHNDMSKASLNF